MIVLLTGPNTFMRAEAFDAIRAAHDRDGALAANTIPLQGARTTPQELEAAALTVPFLADYRLVRVEGLGARLGGGRRRAAGEWERLGEILAAVPDTTVLVFLDGELTAANPLRRAVADAGGEVREFPQPKPRELPGWVRGRARAIGLQLTPGGERALVQLVGADLWTLASELKKLHVYAGDGAVDETIVESLVARHREATIWQLVDAVAEGRTSAALQALDTVRQDGEDPRRILGMLARQFRMIAVACEILAAGGRERDVQAALSVQPFVAGRAVRQSARYDLAGAGAALERIAAADEAIQNYWQGRPGGINQDLAVEVLVAELSGASLERV